MHAACWTHFDYGKASKFSSSRTFANRVYHCTKRNGLRPPYELATLSALTGSSCTLVLAPVNRQRWIEVQTFLPLSTHFCIHNLLLFWILIHTIAVSLLYVYTQMQVMQIAYSSTRRTGMHMHSPRCNEMCTVRLMAFVVFSCRQRVALVCWWSTNNWRIQNSIS